MLTEDLDAHQQELFAVDNKYAHELRRKDTENNLLRHYEYSYTAAQKEIDTLTKRHSSLFESYRDLEKQFHTTITNSFIKDHDQLGIIKDRLMESLLSKPLGLFRDVVRKWSTWSHTRCVQRLQQRCEEQEEVIDILTVAAQDFLASFPQVPLTATKTIGGVDCDWLSQSMRDVHAYITKREEDHVKNEAMMQREIHRCWNVLQDTYHQWTASDCDVSLELKGKLLMEEEGKMDSMKLIKTLQCSTSSLREHREFNSCMSSWADNMLSTILNDTLIDSALQMKTLQLHEQQLLCDIRKLFRESNDTATSLRAAEKREANLQRDLKALHRDFTEFYAVSFIGELAESSWHAKGAMMDADLETLKVRENESKVHSLLQSESKLKRALSKTEREHQRVCMEATLSVEMSCETTLRAAMELKERYLKEQIMWGDIHQLRGAKGTLEQEVGSLQSSLASLHLDHARACGLCDELQRSLAALQATHGDLSAQQTQISQELAQTKAALCTAEADRDNASAYYWSAHETATQLQTQCEELTQSLEEVKQRLLLSVAETESCRSLMIAAQSDLKYAEQKRAESEEESHRHLHVLSLEVERCRAALSTTEGMLYQCRSDALVLERGGSQARSMLSHDVVDLKERNHNLSLERDRIKQCEEAALRHIKSLEDEIDMLKTVLVRAEQNRYELEHALAQAYEQRDKEILQMQHQCEREKTSLEEHRIALEAKLMETSLERDNMKKSQILDVIHAEASRDVLLNQISYLRQALAQQTESHNSDILELRRYIGDLENFRDLGRKAQSDVDNLRPKCEQLTAKLLLTLQDGIEREERMGLLQEELQRARSTMSALQCEIDEYRSLTPTTHKDYEVCIQGLKSKLSETQQRCQDLESVAAEMRAEVATSMQSLRQEAETIHLAATAIGSNRVMSTRLHLLEDSVVRQNKIDIERGGRSENNAVLRLRPMDTAVIGDVLTSLMNHQGT
eukprot:PhF_6_TR27943/c0_g1_i1/m.41192